MDEEETILFGAPSAASAPAPPAAAMASVSLKSALLTSKPQEKPAESTFVSLGVPVMKKHVAPPASPKPRIRYSRDEVLAVRKNILLTDLPPGIDPAFLREQQELAMGDAGFRSSPPRGQGFYGPGSYESKKTWSNTSSMEEPVSAFMGSAQRSGSGWRQKQESSEIEPPAGSSLGQRTPSWQQAYKPTGPARSALVSTPQAPDPPNLPHPGNLAGPARGTRGSFDERGRREEARPGRWGEGNRPPGPRDGPRDGPDGGRGGRQRGGFAPSGDPAEDARNQTKNRSVDEASRGAYVASRWEGSGKDGGEKWRREDGQPVRGHRPTGGRDWRDKREERDNGPPAGGGDKWEPKQGGISGGGGGGPADVSAADFEAERQRMQAEWRQAQASNTRSVDDRESEWLVDESRRKPAEPAVDKLFGDALGDVAAPAQPAEAGEKSSRFAKWFGQGAPQQAPPPAQAMPPPPQQHHQQHHQQPQAAQGSLPAALMQGLAGAAMPPMPKMPASFKTLEELEGQQRAPAAPPPAGPPGGGGGGELLQMLHGGGRTSSAPVAAPPPEPESPTAAGWKMAAAALTPEPAAPPPAPKQGATAAAANGSAPHPEPPSQLSSLLQGLGIPIQQGGPAPPSPKREAPPPSPRLAGGEAAKSPSKGGAGMAPPPGFQGAPGNFPPQFPPGHGGQPPPGQPMSPGQFPPPMSHHMMPPQMHPGMPPPPGAPWGRMPPPGMMPPGMGMGMPPPGHGGMPPHGHHPPPHMMHSMPPPPDGFPGSMPMGPGGMPGMGGPSGMPGMGGPPPGPGGDSLSRFFGGGMPGAPQGQMPQMPHMPHMPPPPSGQQKTLEELERQMQR